MWETLERGGGGETEVKVRWTYSTELLGTLRINLAQTRAGRQRDGTVARRGAPSNVAGTGHAGNLLLALLADRELGTAECREDGWDELQDTKSAAAHRERGRGSWSWLLVVMLRGWEYQSEG